MKKYFINPILLPLPLIVLLLLFFANVSHASNPNIFIDEVTSDGSSLTVKWTLLSKVGIQADSGQRAWGIYPSVNGNLSGFFSTSDFASLRCVRGEQGCTGADPRVLTSALWSDGFCSGRYLDESGYTVGNQYINTFSRVRNTENTAWVQASDLTSSDTISFSFFSTKGGNACQVDTLKFVDPQDYDVNFPGPAEQGISVSLSWSKNEDPDFESYRIFRDTVAGVDLNDTLVATVTDQNQTTFVDEGSDPDSTNYYRVFVFDRAGLSSGSNEENTE